MAGHSHWAGIKRKKALIDDKRGRLFSALAKNIISAARAGSDPDANLQLRYAIDAAKAVNMPKKNIERAVLKGSGQLPGVTVVMSSTVTSGRIERLGPTARGDRGRHHL